MRKFNIPRRFRAFLLFAFCNALFFTLIRFVFYFVNKPDEVLSSSSVVKAFWIGFRFDLRIAFLFALALGIFFLFPYKKWLKKFELWLFTFAFAAIMLIYFVDFGYYAYLTERINAYIFDLAANTATSAEMVWQSYPVITLSFVLFALSAGFYFCFKKLLDFAYYGEQGRKKDYWYALIGLLVAAAFVHGRFSQYPLRWSNAYFSSNSFISALALNPLQNLFDTYKFAKDGQTYDENKVREYYDLVADYLGVKNKDKQKLNFERIITPPLQEKPYNVVVILTESFAYDKSSFNNPELETTPKMAALAQKGRLFKSFFTPTAGTAKGVFTSITGMPDTSAVKTSSRNPVIVRQHTLINDLDGYKKFYFIGGSTNWGNINTILRALKYLKKALMKMLKETMFGGFRIWICSAMPQRNYPKHSSLSLLLYKLPVFTVLIQYPKTAAVLKKLYKTKICLKNTDLAGMRNIILCVFRIMQWGNFLTLSKTSRFIKILSFLFTATTALPFLNQKIRLKQLLIWNLQQTLPL